MGIRENIESIEQRVQKACQRAKRNREEITIIAVSKTKPVEMLKEAMDLGMKHFGENKVQEIMEKYEHFPKEQNFHMIGHLQRNKVKFIVDKVKMIHSVDSIRLANEIEKECAKKNIVMPILLEVNVSCEESKFGFKVEEVMEVVEEIKKMQHLQVKGLMTIAPNVENAQENRIVFRKLKKLLVDINTKKEDNNSICILSMGMTNDFEVAIEEGATMIRVGTGIFGERDYSI